MNEQSQQFPLFYSAAEIAKRFQLSLKWLYRDRNNRAVLPYIFIGRKVCYPHDKLTEFLRHKEIHLMTTSQAASFMGMKTRWLIANRSGHNPIKYFNLGRLVRYHAEDIQAWLQEFL